MYNTSGIDAIATITELRSKTTELLDHVRETQRAVLIQKNNVPFAVVIDWDTYSELIKAQEELAGAADRGPRPLGLRSSASEGEPSE